MGIHRYLIRREPVGDVGWYGTIHHSGLKRQTRVVISTLRGEWLGTVLSSEPGPDPQPAAPIGEVVRQSSQEDERKQQQSRRAAIELAADVSKQLRKLGQVIDLHVSLCRQHAIIVWLGDTTAELGRWSVKIASSGNLQSVQFLSCDQLGPGVAVAASRQREPAASTTAGQSSRERLRDAFGPNAAACRVRPADRQPLGMHGVYRQRKATVTRQTDSTDHFFVRIRLCGGRTSGRQLLQFGILARRFAGGTLRLTSRQGLQIHNVPQANVRPLMHGIEDVLATSAGTCGNTLRNVMCCPRSPHDRLSRIAWELAHEISQRWTPVTVPPWDAANHDEADAPTVLPHKWKVSVATESDNCVEALAADVGLVVRRGEGQGREAVDVFVGGSLSYKPNRRQSFPALAKYFGTVAVSDAASLVGHLQQLFRQHDADGAGTRHMRRWKYVVHQFGVSGIRARIEEQSPGILRQQCPAPLSAAEPHWGWSPEADGTYAFGWPIPAGLFDFDGPQREEIENLFTAHPGPVRITPDYGVLLCSILPTQRTAIEQHAGPLSGTGEGRIRRCPALPTCHFANCEISSLVQKLAPRGAAVAEIAISGCSHGCSRPLTAGIGIIAEKPNEFALFKDGTPSQLGRLVARGLKEKELAEGLQKLLEPGPVDDTTEPKQPK